MHYTYILYSEAIKKYYTGQTEDLERRILEHNRGKTSFMAKGVPWKLVYSKSFTTRTEAVKLEKQIKKRGAARYLDDNKISKG